MTPTNTVRFEYISKTLDIPVLTISDKGKGTSRLLDVCVWMEGKLTVLTVQYDLSLNQHR